ncbi:membrane protein [Fulvivirga kasyanovii]|uniref:Long-chain fatty acid transport protein n=1 Tax=Fulvivirga kasyanovii TaxID=396812 RepID=A0ABW9RPH5_9BACT|nr:hypothetical protein [Fulvivirga kasyanovii]MTI25010.1 hypothetical protein [Fulvivirga kasyanovii]
MHKIKSVLLGVALTVTSVSVWGQAAKSPFTSRGLGDIYDMSLVHNQGMGGLGISNGSYWHLNNVNPALLPYNSLTIFTAGFIGERRTLENSTTSETNSGGNLNFLAMAFPVKPGIWTTSLGLMPYSNVDYKFSYTDLVPGTDTEVQFTEEGSGGFNQFYWSNGVAINKRFFVGVKATYLFSSIETKYSDILVDENLAAYSAVNKELFSVSDFLFSAGLAFNQDSIFNNKIKLKAGLTYEFSSDVKSKRAQSFGLEQVDRPVLNAKNDTIRGSITMPQAIGAGISFSNGFKWMAGIDVKMQQWSDYKDFGGDNSDNLKNSMKITLGGEFTPDYGSVNSYLKRVTYRLGFGYEETPYTINGNQVKDFGINFGWSLPVGRFSSLDMAFKYGQRGDVQDNLVSEDYFKVYLGFNFNDQWFIKRKYD